MFWNLRFPAERTGAPDPQAEEDYATDGKIRLSPARDRDRLQSITCTLTRILEMGEGLLLSRQITADGSTHGQKKLAAARRCTKT